MHSAYCELTLPALDELTTHGRFWQPTKNGTVTIPARSRSRLNIALSDPVETLIAQTVLDVPAVLERVATLAETGLWLAGFVAYEAAAAFDAALVGHTPVEGLPVAAFAAFRGPSKPRPRGEALWGVWHDITKAEDFAAAVTRIRAEIAEGRFYQVNHTTRWRAPFWGDAGALFDALRISQPGAYSAWLDFGRWQLCSVSPELFFHFRPARNGVPARLTLRPMKGTAARHDDPAQDDAAAEALRQCAKNRAENLMIVDLLRNDVSKIAELHGVTVPALYQVEPWSTVWQMTSTIEARLKPKVGVPEIFAALFPCGSVTGAPKVEAMRAIRELESAPRGVYCGAIGLVKPGGEACFNVAIRSVVIDTARQMAECGIGSGIVADSSIEGEADEWRSKTRFLRRACPDYALLETLLWRRGRYWLLDEHLARLAASAQALGFPYNRGAILAALEQVARQLADGRWRVRLSLAMDGTLNSEVAPFARQRGPVICALANRPIDRANPWLRHKTNRRALYTALERPSVFDTLLCNEQGEVTEFTRGNLVVKLDGQLLTPALACGLLPGTLRAVLLRRGTLREAVLTLGDLAKAEKLWFINSLRGALPVTFISSGKSPCPPSVP